MEIYPKIHMIEGFASRQYLLIDKEEATLIDAGLKLDAGKILSILEGFLKPPIQFVQILITHADGDHYGGVNAILAKYPGLQVRASAIECAAIRDGVSSRKIAARGCLGIFFGLASSVIRSEPTPCTGDLEPGMELPVLGGLRVLDTSGHTPGHRSLYLEKHGVLFAGDSILVHGQDLAPSTGANTWDLAKAKKAFDLQLSLDPGIIAGGHGWLKRR